MPKSNSVDQNNISFITIIEDAFDVYIQTDNFDELEKYINELFNQDVKVEKKLMEFYQQEFNYLKQLKLVALAAKKTITELNETDNLFALKTFKEKLGQHKFLDKEAYQDQQIYKYVTARYHFIFAADVPPFTLTWNQNTNFYQTIIPLLKNLADQNFLPACHILGCYLDDLSQRTIYIDRAVAGHYPLSKILLAKQYLFFFLETLGTQDNSSASLSAPLIGVDANKAIYFFRNHIQLNFVSAAFYKIKFLKRLEKLISPNDRHLHDEKKPDLMHLAQILDRMETGRKNSTIQDITQVRPLIISVKEKNKEFLSSLMQNKPGYLSIGDNFSWLNNLLNEINNFQLILCAHIREQISIRSNSQFFKPKLNESLFYARLIKYASLKKSNSQATEFLNNPLMLEVLEKPYIATILSLIGSLKKLSELIIRLLDELNINDHTIASTKKILETLHGYAEGIFSIVYSHRRTLLAIPESPFELNQSIKTYFEIFYRYIENQNSNRDLRGTCFSAFLNLLNSKTEGSQMYGEILCQLLVKAYEENLDQDNLYQQVQLIIYYYCTKAKIPFENYENLSSKHKILQILCLITMNQKNLADKIADKNPAISLEIEQTLNVIQIFANEKAVSPELEDILQGKDVTPTYLDQNDDEESSMIQKSVLSKPEEVQKLPLKEALPYEQVLRNILCHYNESKYNGATVYHEVCTLASIRKLELKFSHLNPADDLILLSLKELENALRRKIIDPNSQQSQTDTEEKRPTHSPHSIN